MFRELQNCLKEELLTPAVISGERTELPPDVPVPLRRPAREKCILGPSVHTVAVQQHRRRHPGQRRLRHGRVLGVCLYGLLSRRRAVRLPADPPVISRSKHQDTGREWLGHAAQRKFRPRVHGHVYPEREAQWAAVYQELDHAWVFCQGRRVGVRTGTK